MYSTFYCTSELSSLTSATRLLRTHMRARRPTVHINRDATNHKYWPRFS